MDEAREPSHFPEETCWQAALYDIPSLADSPVDVWAVPLQRREHGG
jgi:hypothetical protein